MIRAFASADEELRCLAIAEGDGSCLVEEKRVHVARGFDCAARHGEHVVLHQAVHAGDAYCGEQAADGCGNQTNQQRDEDEDGLWRVRIDREGLQRRDGQKEDDGESRKQDAQGNFVRGLLAFGTLDQRDHSIEEGLSGVGSDFDLHPIRQHARAASHRRSIPACLANDWSGLAGDCRFVDRCHAFDDLAVAGNKLAGFDSNHVAGAEL